MLIQEALREKIRSNGWTEREAARRMGISRGNISEILAGYRGITPNIALKFERVLGLEAEQILLLQSREQLELLREEEANGNGIKPAPTRKKRSQATKKEKPTNGSS